MQILRLVLVYQTVLAGKDHKMFADLNSPWIVIPMKVEGTGNFELAITMEEV